MTQAVPSAADRPIGRAVPAGPRAVPIGEEITRALGGGERVVARRGPGAMALRVAVIALILVATGATLGGGVRLRERIWDYTLPVRYTNDIGHGLDVGQRVLAEGRRLGGLRGEGTDPLTLRQVWRGFLAYYDRIQNQTPDGNYDLDYPPLRLAVMSSFAWYWDLHGERQGYHEELAHPLRRVNLFCEMVALVPLFLVVRLWARRGQVSRGLPLAGSPGAVGQRQWPLSAGDWPWVAGLIAALLVWFNPSTMLDAYAWPQWDVWLLPFYLVALLAASTGWWALAGIAVATGAMFKGQILFGAGVLLVWPLARGHIGAALRLLVGAVAATAVIVSPWMLPTPMAWAWLGGVVLAVVLLSYWAARGEGLQGAPGRPPRVRGVLMIVVCAAAAGLAMVPWLAHRGTATGWPLVILGVALAATPIVVGRLSGRSRLVGPCWVAAVVAAAILLASLPFKGSWGWWGVGFSYPTRHFQMLHIGPSSNLAALFGDQYHWQLMDKVFTLNLPFVGPTDVALKYFLTLIYGVTLVLCGIGAAIHDRRGSPKVLIAAVAPFVLSFALLPQQHERYLLWAAVFTVVGVAVSLSMTVMHLLVTAISALMIFTWLADQNTSFWPNLRAFADGATPGLAWMVLLVAGIYLYQAVVPERRRRVL